MRQSERLPEYRCPCCFRHLISHVWFSEDDDEDGAIRHLLVCNNCGRSTLPMDTEALAIQAFVNSLETCWYADADTVLLSIDTLNDLIKRGVRIERKQLDKLDLRRRLG